jgi:hypothetical protein
MRTEASGSVYGVFCVGGVAVVSEEDLESGFAGGVRLSGNATEFGLRAGVVELLVFPLRQGEACAGGDAGNGRGGEGFKLRQRVGVALAGEVECLLHPEGWKARAGGKVFFQLEERVVRRGAGEQLAEGGIEEGGFGQIGILRSGCESGCGCGVVAFAREGESAQKVCMG